MRLSAPLARAVRRAVALASERGLTLYAVGGVVRDAELGLATRDLDLVVEGDPAPLARALASRSGGQVRGFDRFGTARLLLPGGVRLDFARARAETYARPAALPEVRPAALADDLRRRDFTVNAMARELGPAGAGALIDPFGGLRDLRARRLRALHAGSFRDDPTRLWRGARYAGRFGLRPEPATRRWIGEAAAAGLPGLLSRERLRQELIRVLEEKDPGPALRLARRWGLWPALHPAFRWPAGAAGGKSALARLGAAALAMGPEAGLELARSLPLPRSEGAALEAALEAAARAQVPASPLSAQAAEILALGRPGLPAAALKPRLLRGGDLAALGLAPGPEYARWLSAAAAAQWRGEFSTRAGAKAWLRRRIS